MTHHLDAPSPGSADLPSIEARLRAFSRRSAQVTGRAAAVAIALARSSSGEWCFPLTLRSSRLRVHAGQYALPGGRMSAGESALQAAVRETSEEVGLGERQWQSHYLLDDYVTRSGHIITPVVLVTDQTAARLRPNPAEVHQAFYVPLSGLGAVEPRAAYDDSACVAFALHVGPRLIFAPTGAILLQFRDLVLEGKTTRVQGVGEPVFAWS